MLRAKIKPLKAWAIVDPDGDIHLDKVMVSRAEAWGLLAEEESTYEDVKPKELEKWGYRCVRVNISPCRS